MEAYNKIKIGDNRDWKTSEIMILVAIASMYSGLILAVLGIMIK